MGSPPRRRPQCIDDEVSVEAAESFERVNGNGPSPGTAASRARLRSAVMYDEDRGWNPRTVQCHEGRACRPSRPPITAARRAGGRSAAKPSTSVLSARIAPVDPDQRIHGPCAARRVLADHGVVRHGKGERIVFERRGNTETARLPAQEGPGDLFESLDRCDGVRRGQALLAKQAIVNRGREAMPGWVANHGEHTPGTQGSTSIDVQCARQRQLRAPHAAPATNASSDPRKGARIRE